MTSGLISNGEAVSSTAVLDVSLDTLDTLDEAEWVDGGPIVRGVEGWRSRAGKRSLMMQEG